MEMSPAVDPELQIKAEQKREFVQNFIRSLERALASNQQQDRQWLRKIIDPSDACFVTLVKLVVEPKYRDFVSLKCVSLRAVQIILRIAAQFVEQRDADHSVGSAILINLAGEPLANEAFLEACDMAQGSEPNVACNAMLLLGELGPEALSPQLLPQLLDLFVALPGRADDLVEVALRAHAWGGRHRAALLARAIAHPGGRLLCEVLLQVINRADKKRQLRAVKVLSGSLALEGSERLLYTNDIRVLVEILLRELPNSAGDAVAFGCHAECFKALAGRCEAARSHRRVEAMQVLVDLRADEQSEPAVRKKCAEVLAVLGGA